MATTDLGSTSCASGTRGAGRTTSPFRGETGPRHSRWHPSEHLFVVTELSNELYALAPDASGQWRVVAGVALSPVALAGDAAAELAFSRDGRFVYAGLRGSNTVAVVEVRGDGAQLRPIALVDSGVDGPRHHVVVRDTLLIAGQRSDEVVALTIDERTGVPGRARRRVDALADLPSPGILTRLPPSRSAAAPRHPAQRRRSAQNRRTARESASPSADCLARPARRMPRGCRGASICPGLRPRHPAWG
jgi:hypothetical protein